MLPTLCSIGRSKGVGFLGEVGGEVAEEEEDGPGDRTTTTLVQLKLVRPARALMMPEPWTVAAATLEWRTGALRHISSSFAVGEILSIAAEVTRGMAMEAMAGEVEGVTAAGEGEKADMVAEVPEVSIHSTVGLVPDRATVAATPAVVVEDRMSVPVPIKLGSGKPPSRLHSRRGDELSCRSAAAAVFIFNIQGVRL